MLKVLIALRCRACDIALSENELYILEKSDQLCGTCYYWSEEVLNSLPKSGKDKDEENVEEIDENEENDS